MSDQFKSLRRMIMVFLALLFLQFELGMAVIMSDPPHLSPFNFSVAAFRGELDQAAGAATIHTLMGGLLVTVSIVNLVMVLRSGLRSIKILGVLSFIGIVVAAGGGTFFVLSGFQNDHASHAMATNFILSFAFLFLELYYIKRDRKAKAQ